MLEIDATYYGKLKRLYISDISFNAQDIMKCTNHGVNDMSNTKKDDKVRQSMTSSSISKLFEGKNFAFLATLMKDGSPQVTPTWVDIDKNSNTILVNTAKGRTKHTNVSTDPRVAVSIIDFSNPYDMVTVRGKVIEHINGKVADEHIDKMAKKYLDKDKYPGRRPGEERVLLRIKPEHVAHK
jgi:PPOX class probable F420-dependent enzyme